MHSAVLCNVFAMDQSVSASPSVPHQQCSVTRLNIPHNHSFTW